MLVLIVQWPDWAQLPHWVSAIQRLEEQPPGPRAGAAPGAFPAMIPALLPISRWFNGQTQTTANCFPDGLARTSRPFVDPLEPPHNRKTTP